MVCPITQGDHNKHKTKASSVALYDVWLGHRLSLFVTVPGPEWDKQSRNMHWSVQKTLDQ